jgi:hypothetical protein
LDYLVPHFLQPILNLCDIDILAPGLLAFAGGLFVLRGRFLCGRHVDCSVRGLRMSKKPSGVDFANKSSKFQIGKVRNFADSSDDGKRPGATLCITWLDPLAANSSPRGLACSLHARGV